MDTNQVAHAPIRPTPRTAQTPGGTMPVIVRVNVKNTFWMVLRRVTSETRRLIPININDKGVSKVEKNSVPNKKTIPAITLPIRIKMIIDCHRFLTAISTCRSAVNRSCQRLTKPLEERPDQARGLFEPVHRHASCNSWQ